MTRLSLCQRISGLLSDTRLRSRLLRGGAGSVFVKGLHSVLEIGVAVVMARLLGPAGFGVYALATATIRLLAIPAQAGLPILVLKEVAALRATENWATLRGLLVRTSQGTLLISFSLAALAATTVWAYSHRLDTEFVSTFWWAVALLPLLALGSIRGAALRGLHRIVAGQLPEFVIRPALLLLLTFAQLYILSLAPFTASSAMLLQVVSAAVAFAVGTSMLLRHIPPQVLQTPPHFETKRWLRSAVPLSLVAGMYMLYTQADLILLGLLRSPHEVGVYRVASQSASLVAFFLTAANTTIAPFISQFYALHDMEKLQRLVTMSARAILACSLPMAIILLVFGKKILVLTFGAEFATGYLPMAILVLGQTVNAFMGPVGNLQNMTGRERDSAMGITITALLNLALNLLLIPRFGILGGAIASAAGMVTWNVVLWIAARKHLGIDCMAIPLLPMKRNV